ncbi:CAP domain-containing protein [Shimia sp. R10_1]|uniref:CAP domain-containing protein n=1 Tax=Shimia sp. R10_1 TaxID=2821095 RepID=UPI001ADD47A1|nr:CAP domain-containing protein [Shimia sp. R10_1]MBO9473208.1 CAP domain-containing protein [Shimia sp. R10_1]
MRVIALLLAAAVGLAACGTSGGGSAKQYRIDSGNTSRVQFRVLDSVNALRQASGAPAVTLNAQLNAAAATHARDMSRQNRPWHFGSDGSSPLDRVARVGYPGTLSGETISESYESEVETLAAWMEQDDTRSVILDRAARDMGFAWFQEDNGKIWWTLVMGEPTTAQFTTVADTQTSEASDTNPFSSIN